MSSRSGGLGQTWASAEQRPAQEDWQAYKAAPCQRLRNQLIQRYLPVVRFHAQRVHARVPDEVELDDLVSAGLFGLVDAIDGFELDRNIKFETYCAPRIRGAILDELRAMDWVPRLVRSRSGMVERERRSYQAQHGHNPSDEQIRDRLGVDTREFMKIRRDSSAVNISSLSCSRFPSDSSRDLCEIDVIRDAGQVNPLSGAQRADLKRLVTAGLSRSERLILMLYYYQQMTMKEIGAALDLSESRVSQMHSSVLARLQAQWGHRAGELRDLVN